MNGYLEGGEIPPNESLGDRMHRLSNYESLLSLKIRQMARTMRRELDTEMRLTHHFYSNGIHFKIYLN